MSLPIFFTEPHILSGLDASEPILLGLSGGADSSALLHLLCSYREKSGCMIFAAHLNHGIRKEKYGNEASRDEAFCRDMCRRLDAELFVKALDIPSMSAASGRSLETEARDARYAFFADIMRENNIKILATAHNSDDNLETQLQNLARGCGIDGLIGIPEVRKFDAVNDGIIIRPIIRAEKREIISYCHESSIEYVTDSTNFENDCTRNTIRNEIIPTLTSLFPSVRRSAQRLASSAAQDSDFILLEARSFLDSNKGCLRAEDLKKLHPALKKRVIMLAFEQKFGFKLENIHLSSILSLLGNQRNGASVSLPNKTRAELVDGCLCLEAASNEQEIWQYKIPLELGFNFIENTPFCVSVSEKKPQNEPEGYAFYAAAEVFDSGARLFAMNRSPGDTVPDGGINKKIKKLMCDKKVPLRDRDILPIISSQDSILYVPLCAISDEAKPKGRKKIIHINIYKTNFGG